MEEKKTQKINFTEAALAAIKPPASGRVTYHDIGTRGLQLRVSSTGVKSFSVYRWISAEGKPERLHLGRYPHDYSVKQAREEAMKINLAVAQRENPAAALRAAKGETTLGVLFEKYIKDHIEVHRKHPKDIRELWERNLGEMRDTPKAARGVARTKSPYGVNWQHRPLSSITHAEVDALHKSVGKNSPGTANYMLTILRSMFNLAEEWFGFTGKNPATKIRKFKKNDRERYLKDHEAPLFFEAVKAEPKQDIRDYVFLSIYTGQRKNNVLSMAWSDLDLENATWTLPHEKTKNGSPITIPLSPEAQAILLNRHEQRSALHVIAAKEHGALEMNPWVFPSTVSKLGRLAAPEKSWFRILDRTELFSLVRQVGEKKSWSDTEMEKEKKPVTMKIGLERMRKLANELGIEVNTAGVKDLHIHDLRRTLGSWMASTGASVVATSKALGHKTLAMALIYQRIASDPVRGALDTATAAIVAASEKKPGATIHQLSLAAKKRKTGAG